MQVLYLTSEILGQPRKISIHLKYLKYHQVSTNLSFMCTCSVLVITVSPRVRSCAPDQKGLKIWKLKVCKSGWTAEHQRSCQAPGQTRQPLFSSFSCRSHLCTFPIYYTKRFGLCNYIKISLWGLCTSGAFEEKDREPRGLKVNKMVRIEPESQSEALKIKAGSGRGWGF